MLQNRRGDVAANTFANMLAKTLATFAAFAMLVMTCTLVSAPSALALSPDTAGSASTSDNVVTQEKVDSDIFWAGNTTTMSGLEVGGDILAAGNGIMIDSSSVSGSIRAAGNSVTINSTQVGGNATVAGASVQLGQGTSVNGAYVFANDFGFYGSARYLSATGTSVVIDGEIDGDVDISADNVTIGPNAVISGKLVVRTNGTPAISENASIGEQSIVATDGDAMNSILPVVGFAGVMGTIASALGTMVLSVLIAWLLRKPVEASARMFRTSGGSTLLIGLLTMFAAPIIAIFLLALIVTASLSVALLCLIAALACVAVPFTSAAMGRVLFKDMNHILSALIVGAIAGLLETVPFLGFALMVFCSMFLAGFCAKSLFSKTKKDAAAPMEQPPVQY